jgi:putative transcriptional regulator
MSRPRSVALAALVLLVAWLTSAAATDLRRPLILVATPTLQGALYSASVLVVAPAGSDAHIGFIVNHPTELELAVRSAEQAGAPKTAPLYLGGPLEPALLFALVRRTSSPGGNSLELLPGLYAAYDQSVVASIAATEPDNARFMAGFVAWGPGELRAEIDAGAWNVLEPDAALVMEQPDGLWERLVRYCERLRNTI